MRQSTAQIIRNPVLPGSHPDPSALRVGADWHPVGPPLDATVLSDEHAEEFEDGRIRALGLTGAFAGLWAWDLTGGGLPADFDEAAWRALR
ncbi:hypothetical protein KYY02_29825 [Streptomyces pimonensis]|uniref:Beta-xylosidase C-terminal Concanavalin A-like domain-containing protein n=1 Tax=Streptomyces pimonensis TaxID=2860288 RepID=A0ABV4J704_9ACTN